MAQNIGNIKTVVRIINAILIRQSEVSYEMIINLEALDSIGDVAESQAHHDANNMIQAWTILQNLRPGSIHNVEANFLFEDKGFCLMTPSFSPFCGDLDRISELFSHHRSRQSALAFHLAMLQGVSGRIKDVQIEKTRQDGDIAIIHLAERDDCGLVIFPDLLEKYKNFILREDYLEYRGIPQECCLTGDNSETMIFVKTIAVPTLLDETEDIDYEQ